MKPWLTYAEAALYIGRSKRTIRRWVSDTNARVRTQRDSDGTPRVNAADIARVEAEKTAYRIAPTFGRAQL